MIVPTARAEIDFAQVTGGARLRANPSGRGQRDAVAGRFRVIEITVTVLPVSRDERRNALAEQTVKLGAGEDGLSHVIAVRGKDGETAGRELARKEFEQVERAQGIEMRDERAAPDQIKPRVEL